MMDQGKGFMSEVVTELCTQFGVGKIMIKPYHPQGNGQVERAHQTLGNMIGKLENEYKKHWPKHLTKLTHTYNSTRSAVTGYSPHFLMFGWGLRLPIDFDEDVPVYVIKHKQGRRQTLHHNRLFLVGQADTALVMAKLFQTMSTMMLPETPGQEVNAECEPLMELEPDVDAQDTSGWRFLESMSNAVNCMSNAVGAVKASTARRRPHE